MTVEASLGVYLSIVAMPPGLSREDLAAGLAEAGVADEESLRLRFALTPPLIAGLLMPDKAALGVQILRDFGGDAFGCTLADIESLGQTRKIKDLRVEDSRFEIDLWRGEPEPIPFDSVRAIVRATVRITTLKVNPDASTGPSLGLVMVAPEIAIARALTEKAQPAYTHKVATSEKIDLHVESDDGIRIFQIDGDKFAYTALGSLRAHSDKANMDRLHELLKHLLPGVIVDEYFSLWKPPPRFDRLRLPQAKVNNDDAAFAFYSRWAGLMYEHLRGEKDGMTG